MPKFALHKNEYTEDRKEIFNLTIDGVDQFDKFNAALKKDGQKPVIAKFAHKIIMFSQGMKLLPTAFNNLGGNLYEFKVPGYRLYFTHIPEHGHIICLGGKKTRQSKDIGLLKTLEEQILQQIDKNGSLDLKTKNDE